MPTSINNGLKHMKSTKSHRNMQRLCLGAESLNALIVNPTSVTASTNIPLKIAQVLLSGQAFFKPKLKPLERTAHGIQALTALAQVLVLGMLFFNRSDCDNACNPEQNKLCLWATFLSYIYNATLFAGWVPAEVSKEEHNAPTSPIIADTNSEPSSLSSLRTAQTGPGTPTTSSEQEEQRNEERLYAML